MTTSCPLPRSRVPNSIHVPMYEHETGSDDFSSWPPQVQNIMTRELDRWCARNPDLDIIEQSHSVDPVRKVCVTEFLTSAKASS